MRTLFLGAGAIGGYFGGRMAQSSTDITFLVRENRARQLSGGLKIESPLGNATVPVKTIVAGDVTEPFDVIVLTCKAYGLDEAIRSIAPYVREHSIIVPFLNGFGHLQQIENQLPQATIYGGVAQIPATLTADGTVKHLGPQHGMIMGPRQGQAASRSKAEEFVSLAKKSGIDASVSDTIEHEMWEKWVFLTTLAAGTSLTRSNLGEILKTDRGEAFLLGLLDECTTVAAREGFRPSDERTRRYRAHFGDRTSTLTASMTRDMEHGNPIEGDHIIGDMLRRARKHDVSTPYLDAAWVYLQCYEALRRRANAQ